MRSLLITGWDKQAIALGFGFSIAGLARHAASTPVALAQGEAGADMTAAADPGQHPCDRLVDRALRRLAQPQAALPQPHAARTGAAPPLFFFIAFVGALSSLTSLPGFGSKDYTSFQYVFALHAVGRLHRRDGRLRDERGLRNRLHGPADDDGAAPASRSSSAT